MRRFKWKRSPFRAPLSVFALLLVVLFFNAYLTFVGVDSVIAHAIYMILAVLPAVGAYNFAHIWQAQEGGRDRGAAAFPYMPGMPV